MDTDALVTLKAEAMEGLGYGPYPPEQPKKKDERRIRRRVHGQLHLEYALPKVRRG